MEMDVRSSILRKNPLIYLMLFLIPISANAHTVGTHKSTKIADRVKYVVIKKFDDERFKTIGEYFGSHKRRTYFRCMTQDDISTRSGTYFIIGLNRPIVTLPKGTTIRLCWLNSLDEGPHTKELKLPEEVNQFAHEIYCGITSATIDEVLAWKVEFISAGGDILISKESHLWK